MEKIVEIEGPDPATKRLVDDNGVSLLQGHTHRFGAHARTTVDGRVVLGIENMCMCSRSQSYTAHPNWQQGFLVIYLQPKTGQFQWYPVMIGEKSFVCNNRRYQLERPLLYRLTKK